MDTVVSRIEKLTKRVNRYTEESIKMKTELGLEREKNKSLETQLATVTKQLNELEKQNELIRVAKTIAEGEGDHATTKTKIGELVREIDKCIALLNG